MVNPAIFQIVGFQNSGKTTLIKKFIHELQLKERIVVTIKHHGHGGKPTAPEKKDSTEHINAGAVASIVEGEGMLMLQAIKENWSLLEQIQLITTFHPDIILIEGHKYERFPKAVIIKTQEDLQTLNKLVNVQAVFYWDKSHVESIKHIPLFSIHDRMGIQWLVSHIENTMNNS